MTLDAHDLPVSVTVNGGTVAGHVPAHRVVADFLADCGISTVRVSCDQGVCGACTVPVDREPRPSPELVRRWMAGNVCRCTGYQAIVDAVIDAAHKASRRGQPP